MQKNSGQEEKNMMTFVCTGLFMIFKAIIQNSKMRNENLAQKSTRINLYLVEPQPKLNHEFSALRHELKSKNIPYQTIIGFDDAKTLMLEKSNKNVIIINSSSLKPQDLPRELFDTTNNKLLVYPKQLNKLEFKTTPESVTEYYQKQAGLLPGGNKIKLRSIKKDLQKSKEKWEDQLYEKILLMNPRGSNPRYTTLFKILQTYPKVETIETQSNVQKYREGKLLLILEKEAFSSMYKFINGNRLSGNIDLALLGYPEDKDKFKNCVIMTDYPGEIIDYIGQSGTDLRGAKQKLMLKGNSGSGIYNSDQNTGVFMNEDNGQFSFSHANKISQQEGEVVTYNSQGNSNEKPGQGGQTVTYNSFSNKNFARQPGEKVEYDDVKNKKNDFPEGETVSYSNHIPLSSKISETSNIQKNNKPQIKKIKKLAPNTNSGISSILRENDEAPTININTVVSQPSENQKVGVQNEVRQVDFTKGKSPIPASSPKFAPDNPGFEKEILKMGLKAVMDWVVYPTRNQKSPISNGPYFALDPISGRQAPFNNQKQNIGKNSQTLVESPNSKKQVNPRPPQYSANDSSKKSIASPLPSGSRSPASSPKFAPDNPGFEKEILKMRLKAVMDWVVYPTRNQKSPISNGPYFALEPISGKEKVEIVPYKTSDSGSKEAISQASLNNSSQTLGYRSEGKPTQLIQQKYKNGNVIKELSEEYRGSYVSYGMDQNSQRMTINSTERTYLDEMRRTNSQNPALNIETNEVSKRIIKSLNNDQKGPDYNQNEYQRVITSSSGDRPTSRVVRQQPRSPETLYVDTSNKKIDGSATPVYIQQSTYRKSTVISPPANSTNANSYSYQYTNPYKNINSNSINSMNSSREANNQGSATSNRDITTSYYQSKTYISNNVSPAKVNLNSMSNPAVYNPNINRTSNYAYDTNTNTNNNMSNSPSSRTSYYNANTTQEPLSGNTSSLRRDSNKSYLASIGIDQSKYDIITDENGIRRYRLKETSPYSTTPTQNAQAQARIVSTPPKNAVITTNQQAITTNQTISSSSSNKNLFNFNDYDEHIDERGNRYYTVKKSTNAKSNQSASITSSQPGALLVQSKKQQVITSSVQPNLISNQQRDVTELSRGKFQGTRYSVQLSSPTNASGKITSESKYVGEKKQPEYFSKYYSTSAKEIQRVEPVSNTVASSNQQYKGIEVGVSKPVDYTQIRFSQYSNQVSQASRMTPDSQITDSKTSSMYKFNAHLYGETKPYLTSLGDMKIDSPGELQKVGQEMRTLRTSNNFTHYIIDTSHPLRYEIEQIPDVQDKVVEVDYAEKIYEYMLKKPLPNEYYDIGFIFVNSKNISKIPIIQIVDGYYLVEINDSSIPIDIKKDKKKVIISDLKNLGLAKKLLLAPNIQHFVFYPRSSQGQISTVLSLFPNSKFNKYGYNSRPELQGLFQTHLRNKGRLTRTLIFVNPTNLGQIAPLMDHALNHETFTMICSSKNSVDNKIKDQYKKVRFQNNYDFGSYGSVISLANKSYIEPNNVENKLMETETKQDQRNESRPKIYIQRPHKGVDLQIEKAFPDSYDIRFFTQTSEIKDKSRDNFILLHRQADNVGTSLDRNTGMLILLGGRKGDRSPAGTVTIETVSELIEDVL